MTEFGTRAPRTTRRAKLRALLDPDNRATWYAAMSWIISITTLVALICNKVYGLGPQIAGVTIILPPMAVVAFLQFLLIQINHNKRNRLTEKKR
jgi:hypothetical protein